MDIEQAKAHIKSLIKKANTLRTREMSETDREAAIAQVDAEIEQLQTITGPVLNKATVHIEVPPLSTFLG